MATTTPATATAGIAGDPAALYAAADEMTATAKDYFNAADAIAAHGRAVTANWYGDASDAAGRHIQALSTRVHVGFEVYTKAADAVRTYARALSLAQDAWITAAAHADAASTTLGQAHQAVSAAAAIPTTDATGQVDVTAQAARSQAADDAATAVSTASTALAGAQQDMDTAVADALAANQHAAEAINACCDQLAAMGGNPSTSPTAGATGTTAAYLGATLPDSGHPAPPQHHESAWDGAIDWAGGAENWLEDNSGTIADVLGTATLISAFIPGVDLAVTPILGALSASAGIMAAHHAYADGDEGEGDQQLLMAGLSILPDGRMLGEGLRAGKALKEADNVADTARATRGPEDSEVVESAARLRPPGTVSDPSKAATEKPDWVRRLEEGSEWHRTQQAQLKAIDPSTAVEVHVAQPGRSNSYPYNRVDAYNPNTREIISMKNTQLAAVEPETARAHIREAAGKYSPGTQIAETPSNVRQGLVGGPLRGRTVLLVPKQVAQVPDSIVEYARARRVLIRESDGITP